MVVNNGSIMKRRILLTHCSVDAIRRNGVNVEERLFRKGVFQ